MDKINKITQNFHKRNHSLTDEEALTLFESHDLLKLGEISNNIRWEKHPENKVSFVIDRNINYTDGCVTECGFCGFHCSPSSCSTLTIKQLLKKV